MLRALDEQLVEACGPTPSWFCEGAWNLTDSRVVARAADWFVTRPLLSLAVVIVAALINRFLRRSVEGLVRRIVLRDQMAAAALTRIGVTPPEALVEGRERAEARASTLSAVLQACVSAVVWSIAVLVVLGIFHINLAPLIAGAGVAGIAIGFGAQSLVRDTIAGFFILLEDQFGVGDRVDVGPAVGIVEAFTLRATTIRAVDGTQWNVPNGSILRVGNHSRAWNRVAVDVTVAADTDVEAARSALQVAVDAVVAADPHAAEILAAPTVVPVERVTAEGVVLRVSLRCTPGARVALVEGLRHAARRDLAERGIVVTALADA